MSEIKNAPAVKEKKKKEENYFDMFITSAEYALKAADTLFDWVKNYKGSDVVKRSADIHAIEHEADIHYRRILEQLHRAFMTPIEREDIQSIAQSIDDVTDLIEDISYMFYMFNVSELRHDCISFVELIVKTATTMKEAIVEFKNYKKSKIIMDKLCDVNHREEEGDGIYKSSVHGLFVSKCPEIDLVRWRELYKKMEDTLDACETVADILESAILKNS